MAVSIKHAHLTAVPDDPAYDVGADEWNADHTITGLNGAAVTNTPAGNIAATDVQAAINELDTEKQPLDSDLTAIAAIAPSNDDIIQRKAGAWTNRTLAQLVTDLTSALDALFLTAAEGNAAYQPLDADLTSWAAITRASGFDTFATTPTLANLGSLLTNEAAGLITFMTTPTSANLAALVTDDVFSLADTELGAIAGLTSAADKLPYFTGAGTAALADLSSAMRTFMTTPTSANLAALISDDSFTLTDAELSAIAGLVSAADKGIYFTGSGTAAMFDLSSAMRTFLTTPSSANLAALITDETGSGSLVFGTAPQISTIELGAATDTTLSRVSAGVMAVEGSQVLVGPTENQPLSGGATITEKDLGTVSSGTTTLDLGDCPHQKYTNNGAHTLGPGTTIASALIVITNGASAGAITTSGWTKVVGSSFTTTNAHKFVCHASVTAAGSLLIVQAMQ